MSFGFTRKFSVLVVVLAAMLALGGCGSKEVPFDYVPAEEQNLTPEQVRLMEQTQEMMHEMRENAPMGPLGRPADPG